ncbi:hypothetical protein Forpe1208_v016711 [Fusarium oxysporum f. sp. rapae]|uniref:Uncharacterized protein n=1 Tax=Fusarium oxysporum f. sp. rapae TaxID=485398 RepID=A0A8J5NGD2_FUSOX|nr:hypothetical protein Forpe1208_v016711 [Fusarium oxysporum f. sp. rapae]
MPTNALTSTWSLGKNRRLDTKHVRTLCAIFTQGGLNRKAEENHLLVLCSRADVSRMMKHLQRQGQSIDPEIPEELPFFDEWLSVNRGNQAEVMAGQHRIKALEAYVQETGANEKELWWTCEFYDKDTLPLNLNLKLRVNRQDPAMADSHGQVWMQVVAASSQDPNLFRGKAAQVEDQMIDVLQLGSEKQFPTRRLATVWRNERWREMATRWCETSIGRATFKISTWDWMISYRIDDYWFTIFRSVLRTLSQLPGDATNEVELADWKKMSEFLGSTRTVDQVRTLFYPPSLSSSSSTTAQNTKRRPGFLTAIDDGRYQEMYKRILTTSQLRFTNIHRLICLSKDDGKVLFQVMSHVVAWLNANPTTTSYRRDNNKPPLRADIAAKLDHCSDRDVRDAEKRLGIFVWESDHHNSTSKAASILLQHEVLDFVLQRVADFKKPAVKLYLEQAPQQVDSAQYTKRFSHETWSGVLTIVQRWVGHDFSSEWMERPRDGHSVHDEQARSADARSSGSTHHLALTESLGDYIRGDPDLAADSASIMEKLGNEAFEAVLNRWLTQQQGQFRPDPAGSHYHEEASTSGPVTVTGPRITPDLYEEEQRVRAQEKAKNPGYDGRSTGVSGSGPDPKDASGSRNRPDTGTFARKSEAEYGQSASYWHVTAAFFAREEAARTTPQDRRVRQGDVASGRSNVFETIENRGVSKNNNQYRSARYTIIINAIDGHDSLLGEITEPEDCVPVGTAEESNDDGIESFAGTDFVDELYTDDGDLDEHGVSITAIEAQAVNKNDFKIDHSQGSFRMKPEDFIARASAPDFDAAQALEMFQRRYTIDYGRKTSGSRAANPEDRYYPIFHLDMIGIVGRPLRPITRRSGFFDNVTFTLRYWSSSYAGKHVSTNLPFDIRNRTFRIATAASREIWFIVMHPIQSQIDDLSGSHGQRRKRQKASRRSSAVEKNHAKVLAEYIIEIFTDGELLGEGVEPSWGLNDRRTSSLSYDKWTIFQTLFMKNWRTFSENHAYDRFWVDNEPAFHTYDCGANIEIKVNKEVEDLPMETRLRSESEDDEDSDSDSDSGSDSESDSASSEIGPEPDSEMEPGPELELEHETEHEPELEPELGSGIEPEPGSGLELESGSTLDPNDANAVDDHGDDGNGNLGDSTSSGNEVPTEGSRAGPGNDHAIYQEHLYSDGLEHLRTELEKKYNIDNIDQISYALAADINCIERNPSIRSPFQQEIDDGTLSLLADRRALVRHFGGLKGFTFYPLAFHPRYGNFSSPRPPPFLDDVCLVMRDNMSYRNSGADDVLSFGQFHAYSSDVKRTIRHSPEDLLPARGIATGALTLPPSEAKQRGYICARQQRLLRTLSGEQTPDQPSLTMPFAREGHRIRAAMSQRQIALRMEQVVTLRPSKLERRHRHFFTVLHPIFQLMRFFIKEKRAYTTVLRSFLPSIFPTILCSYAKLFELGLAEMHRRFLARAEKGLDLALSEAVAVLDRLGNYCFTGDTRVLMTTVLRPLLTMDSLKSCAWPYVSTKMLDFRGSSGKMDVVRWPRTRDEERKPILLHIASLEYHYGRVVAANCHSRVWFGQLGAEDIEHVGSANTFLGKILRGFWVPQMVAFMAHQLRIQLNQGARSGRDPAEHLRRSQRFGAVLDTWEQSKEPFSSGQFDKLFLGMADDSELMPLPAPSISNKARNDFASEIYEACLKGDETVV